MKKTFSRSSILLKGLITSVCVFGLAHADTTNKTFLLPRAQGVNLALEFPTWRELLSTKEEDKFGAHFQVVPFYQQSTCSGDLSKYFGYNNKGTITVNKEGTNADLEVEGIIHNAQQTGSGYINNTWENSTAATISLSPKHTVYGAIIDYYQELDKLLKGLFFSVKVPIVNVDNDLHFSVKSDSSANKNKVIDFFKGSYSVTEGDANAQKALTHGKMGGSHSETGVADIELMLGYKIVNKDKIKFGLNIGLTIPTGNDADGHWIFEPIVGNGGFWGLGGGLDVAAKVWEKDDKHFRIDAAVNYRYLFEDTQHRVVGLRSSDGTSYIIPQVLVGKPKGEKPGDKQLTPFANLFHTVSVGDMSQIEGALQLAFIYKGFDFGVGYNIFWREKESIKADQKWEEGDTAYAIVSTSHDMTTELDKNDSTQWEMGSYNASKITYKETGTIHIDLNSAATPSYTTHKIFGGIGYIFKEWETPLMLNVGGFYEFASSDIISNWSIFGKIGILI